MSCGAAYQALPEEEILPWARHSGIPVWARQQGQGEPRGPQPSVHPGLTSLPTVLVPRAEPLAV